MPKYKFRLILGNDKFYDSVYSFDTYEEAEEHLFSVLLDVFPHEQILGYKLRIIN